MAQYAKCRKAIQRFLKNGSLGSIGHISCVDRRSSVAGSSSENQIAKEIAAASARRLSGICELLGQEPASVTVRFRVAKRCTSLQAFLMLDEQIGIHYFATFDAGPSEHELWIEGSEGSLRTNGNSVWWRKRGWPVFIPTRIGLFGLAADSSSQVEADSELTAAILESERNREIVRLASDG